MLEEEKGEGPDSTMRDDRSDPIKGNLSRRFGMQYATLKPISTENYRNSMG